jgi:dipeptide/tripeptide permease
MSHSTAFSWRTIIASFADLRRLPRAFWFVIGAFVFESMAYFGVLTLMVPYLSGGLGWGDKWASVTVSIFTGLVTLFMLGIGSWAEKLGLRRALLFALLISTVGRALYSYAAGIGPGWIVPVVVIGSLLIVAIGSSILTPVAYSGIKQYTDARTNSMGYGMIYALMNLGIVVIGGLSSWIRPAVQSLKDAPPSAAAGDSGLAWLARFSSSGVGAVNWVCMGITLLTFAGFLLLMTKRVEAQKVRPDAADLPPAGPRLTLGARLKVFFTEGPFSNARFIFFIFMLLPVRTLFAHQWLTMPEYILRAYPSTVAGYTPWVGQFAHWLHGSVPFVAGPFVWLADRKVADLMEWLVNWINPAIIFFVVPVFTALTQRHNVYRMMVIGSLVSAVPTFLLCWGPDLNLLVIYFVIFSLGEALWSARFLQYAAELAPPGRVAQYMGLAQIPWLLAKATTGFYSGWLLGKFCPAGTPVASLHTGRLWFIYGCIAMLSPIGLWLARKWVLAGWHGSGGR